MRSLCVFCGSSAGKNSAYVEAAETFGQALAHHDIELVWGGGHVGLMGVVADAVLDAGGRAYGVIPEFMADRELAHPRATEIVVVDSMHSRKAAMADRAEAFVALPGGFGTLDELFEIITWAQLHIHHKPVGMLNVEGFFNPLMSMVRYMSAEGFIKAPQVDMLYLDTSAEALLTSMKSHQAPQGDWLGQKLSSGQG